ncbi:SusD/RagB family nutrient-binding outer membrane lipoprotein [Rufibacter latericius]|uniref:SusD/RagB family nutrient-binding outer membrane lipoprotein n=1 Tax=Rufibacter latericius TaxID=2487040 RepID=A0A3M9MTB8_9BACT|nr:SusD/RagB family nutrient-binding outer membrane lipoprotein [Rufibacter latericius]RNI28766.1 SusD/RagB family nutrient-binding outer membrane lipoprotein [Rufibacter latericius]
MKRIYILLLACLAFASCEFDEDINVNPNKPSQASGGQLLANAMLSLPGLSSSPQGEFMAQYLSETQFPGGSLYPEGATNFYGLYTGPLMNLEEVINSTTLDGREGPVENQKAVAKILKAYFFWNITDRWGDVPYTEALKGADNFAPAYDTQESIYNNLFALLKEANGQIVAGDIKNDIVYGGNMDKWKKLGNTIHLLMALRLSEVNPTKGKDEFNQALTAGIMASNADNLVFKHLAVEANENYWYSQVGRQQRLWWALSQTLVNTMKPTADPRLAIYADPNEDGEYVGLPFGKPEGGVPNDYALLGSDIWKQDAPVALVTYAQALFAKAEAAKRGWIAGGDAEAKTNYEEAIKQSVMQWTENSTGVSDFLQKPEIAYDPAKGLEQIATQRYVHLFMHGYEAWAEWRRTGYPSNLVTPGGKAIPARLMYPSNESANNTTNYKAALQRLGGTDGLYGKVWWDKD